MVNMGAKGWEGFEVGGWNGFWSEGWERFWGEGILAEDGRGSGGGDGKNLPGEMRGFGLGMGEVLELGNGRGFGVRGFWLRMGEVLWWGWKEFAWWDEGIRTGDGRGSGGGGWKEFAWWDEGIRKLGKRWGRGWTTAPTGRMPTAAEILLLLSTIWRQILNLLSLFLQNTIQRFFYGWERKGGEKMNEVKKVNLKEMQLLLRKHQGRINKSGGITPGDIKILVQDLIEVLGTPLPPRLAALFTNVLDLSPSGGQVWIARWLERATVKMEVLIVSGLEELEAGYLGLLLEPARVPGEANRGAEYTSAPGQGGTSHPAFFFAFFQIFAFLPVLSL
jgi:hypothetical protein